MGATMDQTVMFEPFDNTFFSVTFKPYFESLMTHFIHRAAVLRDSRIIQNRMSGETE